MSAMFPDEIADYLKNNPGFFEKYADLMATISCRIRMVVILFRWPSGRC